MDELETAPPKAYWKPLGRLIASLHGSLTPWKYMIFEMHSYKQRAGNSRISNAARIEPIHPPVSYNQLGAWLRTNGVITPCDFPEYGGWVEWPWWPVCIAIVLTFRFGLNAKIKREWFAGQLSIPEM
jgi:hypothetical protein